LKNDPLIDHCLGERSHQFSINQSINQKITTYKSDQWCTTHLKTKIKPKDNVKKKSKNSKILAFLYFLGGVTLV